jgi:hypothetical protein
MQQKNRLNREVKSKITENPLYPNRPRKNEKLLKEANY